MEERQQNNLKVLRMLFSYIIDHPEMRFIQALWSLGIIDRDGSLEIRDRFYEEPDITLKRIEVMSKDN